MKQFLFILSFAFLAVSCKQEKGQGQSSSLSDKRQEVEIPSYNFSELQPLFNQNDGKVHVINFWATWCKPCVKELPYFKRLMKETDAEILFVSLDMPKMKETHLKPFVKKREIMSNVALLDDSQSNIWIPKVNKKWDGAIPATLIYKNDQREFFARRFESYKDLENEFKKFE